MTAVPETNTRPCAIDAQDALNACKKCVSTLSCILEQQPALIRRTARKPSISL